MFVRDVRRRKVVRIDHIYVEMHEYVVALPGEPLKRLGRGLCGPATYHRGWVRYWKESVEPYEFIGIDPPRVEMVTKRHDQIRIHQGVARAESREGLSTLPDKMCETHSVKDPGGGIRRGVQIDISVDVEQPERIDATGQSGDHPPSVIVTSQIQSGRYNHPVGGLAVSSGSRTPSCSGGWFRYCRTASC